MIRIAALTGVTAIGLLVCLSGARADEKQALAALEKLGGKMERAEDRANKPIVKVDLTDKKIKDSDLARLKELKELENVQLGYTAITDAGLVHLKDLPNLRILVLLETKVTDKGLQHLKGLKKLSILNVHDTKVTKQGIAELKKALPDVDVIP